MFDGGRGAFEVGARRTGEAGDGRLLALARHFAPRLEIAFGGDSKARLDNVPAQVFELVGDLQLFFQVHGTAGRLLAVAQRGAKDPYCLWHLAHSVARYRVRIEIFCWSVALS